MAVKHLSEIRPVTITVTGAPMSLDAYKAVNRKVEALEAQYEASLNEEGVSEGLVDLAGVTTVITANTPYKIYVFTLTTVFADGNYTFAFVEEAPNVEEAPSLNA